MSADARRARRFPPIAWRGAELRMLLPLALLMPLGFAVTHIAQTGTPDPGPMGTAAAYVVLMLAAHFVLVASGNRGDPLLLPLVATIGGIGLIMLNRLPQDLRGTRAFGLELGMAETQLLWFAVGVVAMLLVAIGFRNDGILRHYKYTWAIAGALLLTITFLFGVEQFGARLWLNVGPVQVQPGEAIKIVLVVFIAGYLAEHRALLAGASLRIGPFKIPPLPYLLPMLAIFVIVMLIVVIMRDLGTALLFLGIFLTMLFVATGRRSYVLLGILLFVAGSYVAYNLFGHVQVRVNNWINPFADPSGDGYQTVQALYAFARGGLFGEGLGQGLPLIGGRLPIPALETDFIFAAIAEELGLVGAFALLALAAALVFRGLRIAALARDDFSAMLAVGLTSSLGLQTLIIAAGNVKLIPLTGITFPFVSYGGSSLLASFVVVGLLLSISHRSAEAAAEGR
ncbi:MAG TPA: FtsW/RodA/SpoVE family cell cycle protein [candidate division Zixibacteria bacterium]|nr:FtsW/RodA/SpoVE family cell cycle protein [candidate division Zixibacteria bacterium]